MSMIIRQTEFGNWLVCDSRYEGCTYYDADTLSEAIDWCKANDILEYDIRYFNEQ